MPKKKDVGAVVAGMGVAMSIITSIYQKLKAKGLGDVDLHMLATPKGDLLLDKLVELMVEARFGAIKASGRPEPTITPIVFARDYQCTLVQARNRMRLRGHVDSRVNDQNLPPEHRNGEREFVLVCFNCEIGDNPNPRRSELLRGLDSLGLEFEGPMELCFVGSDPRTCDFMRKNPIVARRQVWKDLEGNICCPILDPGIGLGSGLHLPPVRERWQGYYHFLCSRK